VNRVHLDTHVAAKLSGRSKIALSKRARRLIDSSPVVISPIVILELQILSEIGRLRVSVDRLLELLRELGGSVLEERLPEAVWASRPLLWTRDPFDRLIVGHAIADAEATLVSFDEQIIKHYRRAIS
jgi:PIN domain nuclease of toxin-antitoxin system